MTAPLSLYECAFHACVWEATAPKVGNVHRGADFVDLTYLDFIAATGAFAPVIERAGSCSVGKIVLESIQATRRVAKSNVNLGMALLIAPLACVPRASSLREGVSTVLHGLKDSDACDAYEAIRLASPGGMGQVEQGDVSDLPTIGFVDAMRLAAERDLVAKQYADGFVELFDGVIPWLEQDSRQFALADAIVRTHLRCLAEWGDSLVARKCGQAVSNELKGRAGATLSWGMPGDVDYDAAIADFDFWLRSDGNRRNPGTSADMVAAALFALLRDGKLSPGMKFYRDQGC